MSQLCTSVCVVVISTLMGVCVCVSLKDLVQLSEYGAFLQMWGTKAHVEK